MSKLTDSLALREERSKLKQLSDTRDSLMIAMPNRRLTSVGVELHQFDVALRRLSEALESSGETL